MALLLKLKDGTEIIGESVKKTGAHLTLRDPFIINYRFIAGQPMPSISVSRYMPFSADHIHMFYAEDIRHTVAPSPTFESYYNNALEYCKDVVDRSVEEELADAAARTKNPKHELTDIYEAILDQTKFDGPLN